MMEMLPFGAQFTEAPAMTVVNLPAYDPVTQKAEFYIPDPTCAYTCNGSTYCGPEPSCYCSTGWVKDCLTDL